MQRIFASIRNPAVFILTVLTLLIFGILVQYIGDRRDSERLQDNGDKVTELAIENHQLLDKINACLTNPQGDKCGANDSGQSDALKIVAASNFCAASFPLPLTMDDLTPYLECIKDVTPQIKLGD